MKNIIDVIDISVKYGSQLVLTDLNFHVSRGEIFGFIGPSGSGKTTIINTLLGIIKPYKGSSKIFEKDSQTLKSSDLTQLGIMSDAIGYYERLSIFENLQIYAHIFGISEKKVDDLLSKVGLIKQKNMKTGNISVGMLQRMLFVRALINSPKLLFLDEPTSGLDPTIARNIRNEIKNLQKIVSGTTTKEKRKSKSVQRDIWSSLKYALRIKWRLEQDLLLENNQKKNSWDAVKENCNIGYFNSSISQSIQDNSRARLIQLRRR